MALSDILWQFEQDAEKWIDGKMYDAEILAELSDILVRVEALRVKMDSPEREDKNNE